MRRGLAASVVVGLWSSAAAMALPTKLRAVLGGSGSAIMGEASVVAEVLRVSGRPGGDESPFVVCYLGTATYDLPRFAEGQVKGFLAAGCEVVRLDVARANPGADAVRAALGRADAVLVSGGNTLFAIDRWRRCGVEAELRAAMARGAVLCGGSAGAICWFDGGHSDSMDPDWYCDAMLAGEGAAAADYEVGPGEKPWAYVRCPCLGFLPGLMCPHHDRTQSNGVLRATDFDAMLLRHRGERGICVDHFAALVVEDDAYSVFALEGKPGSIVAGAEGPDFSGDGAPGIWLKAVAADGGAIEATVVPAAGRLADILAPASAIVEDARITVARAENPSDVERA